MTHSMSHNCVREIFTARLFFHPLCRSLSTVFSLRCELRLFRHHFCIKNVCIQCSQATVKERKTKNHATQKSYKILGLGWAQVCEKVTCNFRKSFGSRLKWCRTKQQQKWRRRRRKEKFFVNVLPFILAVAGRFSSRARAPRHTNTFLYTFFNFWFLFVMEIN